MNLLSTLKRDCENYLLKITQIFNKDRKFYFGDFRKEETKSVLIDFSSRTDARINEFTCKSLMGTVFKVRRLRVEREDNAPAKLRALST